MHPISLARFGKPKSPEILPNSVNFRTCFYVSRQQKQCHISFVVMRLCPTTNLLAIKMVKLALNCIIIA